MKQLKSLSLASLDINTFPGLFQQFWEKDPGQNWEKMIDLTTKLGEINGITHNKGRYISSK